MNRTMPLSAKVVLGLYGVSIVLQVVRIFRGDAVQTLVGFAITLAVFTGLCSRSPLAWMWARWTSALAVIVLLAVTLLVGPSLAARPLVAAGLLVSVATSALSFWLLGLPDCRAYFTRTRKSAED